MSCHHGSKGPVSSSPWSCSFRPCPCEKRSGNFPLEVVSFLTCSRTTFRLFLSHQNSPAAQRVWKVLLLPAHSKLSKLLSGTFVPFGVSYMEASGSHSKRRAAPWEWATIPYARGEPHALLIMEQRCTWMRLYQGTVHHSQKTGFGWASSSRKSLYRGNRKNVVSNTETAAEINLAVSLYFGCLISSALPFCSDSLSILLLSFLFFSLLPIF